MRRSARHLGLALVLCVLGLGFWTASALGDEVVLCKSAWSSYVKARKGSCAWGEKEIPFENAATLCGAGETLDGDGECIPVPEDTNAQTICDSGKILDGDGQCVDDPNACAFNEVLLGGGGGCIGIKELVAWALGKTVFLTDMGFSTNLVSEATTNFPTECGSVTLGLEAGDCICQAIADGSPLVPSGSYKAWLADSFGTPDSRFTKSENPYVRVDQKIVANSYADLVSGLGLLNPINVTETGGPATQGLNTTMTGVGSDGVTVLEHCNNWTSVDSEYNYRLGKFELATDPDWTAQFTTTCSDFGGDHLYCFGQ